MDKSLNLILSVVKIKIHTTKRDPFEEPTHINALQQTTWWKMNKRHESQHVAHDGSDMWRVSVGADAIKQKEIMHVKLSRDL